ncbi:hypothetical protein V5E97_21185 [Singulisphaera sp. Ch08]|uniref:O-antigen ligase domain-containing protein n=1 Tax=Singulisphaera sp. Ch08 TaxID=3120278 RepID=A0AAU7C7X0_9BACT
MDPQTAMTTSSQGSWTRVAVRFLAASCFFPYPALAIGGNNGLQLNQLLALGCVPLLCFRPPGRPFQAYVILLIPIYVSVFLNVMIGESTSLSVLPKEAVSLTLAMLILWPTELIATRAFFSEVLRAATAALLIHSLIGFYQVYSFRNDEFPLLFLYKNPSFRSLEEWSPIYARYIKRPCGLFPEPSAMAASLGPWLAMLTGLILDPIQAKRLGWQGGKATVAVACAFVLLALSRSGCTLVIMAAVMVLCVGKFRSQLTSFGIGKLLSMAVVLLGGVGVLGYAISGLSQGYEERVASSWGIRGKSIAVGLTSNNDMGSLAFGVGPGQSPPIVSRKMSSVPLPEDEGSLAIFSLTVCYYMETGLIGALAMFTVLMMALRAIVRSSAVLLGLCTLGPWLMGVGATTSYMSLSAIWFCLGLMLCWDRLFPPPSGALTSTGEFAL